MRFREFQEWLELNSNSKEMFITKWKDLQVEKNKKRTGKNKKWDDKKVLRNGLEEWNKIILGAYEKIKGEKGTPAYNGHQIWVAYMEEIQFIELFDDSISELELD